MNKLANQTTPAQKLPDEEWNFGDQLKDEKNVNLVRGVFFYEYFRCSGKLRKIVLHCRRYYFDEAGKKPRPPVSGWEGYNYNILYPEEKEAIRQKTNGWEIVGDLMQDLMNNRNFPKTPALKILNKDNQNDRKKDCVNSWFCNLDSTQALRFCGEIMGYCERLADVDGVLKELKEFEDYESFPKNEQQARVFVPLNKDQRVKLLVTVQNDAPNKKTTASLFTEHRNTLFPDQFTKKTKPAKSKDVVIDVESSPVPNPAAMEKIEVLAEEALKILAKKKGPKDNELVERLQDIIKLAKPSMSQGKVNSN